MPLTEQTRDYEILIRFNEDGTIGVHKQSITEVIRDELIIAATLCEPVPMLLEEVLAQLTTSVA